MKNLKKFDELNESLKDSKKTFYPKKRDGLTRADILDRMSEVMESIAPSSAVAKERMKEVAVILQDDVICQKYTDGYFVANVGGDHDDVHSDVYKYTQSFMEKNAKLKKTLREK